MRVNRNWLRGVYSTIKSRDARIRFSFLTGVSKFSKVSLFSGLDNLRDITLNPACSTICGYTEEDLETVFAPELPGLDRERICGRYKGYSCEGAEKVCNPFDVLLLLADREFKAWWFETGTPTFLVETLVKRGVPSPTLDGMVASDELLSTFDVGDIAAEALLFQTGYLTILSREYRGGIRTTGWAIWCGTGRARRGIASAFATCCTPPISRGSSNCSMPFRRHPVRVAQPQRDRALRGVLRERVLLLLRGAGAGRDRGGQRKSRAAGHGRACRRPSVPIRFRGLGAGGARSGNDAVERAGLCRQVPRPGRAGPLGCGGVQRGDEKRGGVQGRSRLTAKHRFRC